MKRGRLLLRMVLGATVLAVAAGVIWLNPPWRLTAWGLFRFERCADGLPRSYWLYDLREHDDAWAAKALGEVGAGDPEVVAALAAALPTDPEKGNWRRTRAVARALEKLGPDAKAALPALCGALLNKNAIIRRSAASAVSAIGLDDAVEQLRGQLADPDPKTRAQAAQALAALAPPSEAAVAALVTALDDKEEDVRYQVVEALGAIGPPAASAVPALNQLVTARQFYVSRVAIDALGRMGPAAAPAIPGLVAFLGDFFDGERASLTLAAIGPDAAPAVVEVLCRPGVPDLERKNAAHAVRGIGAPAVKALVARLHHADPSVRAAAADGLASLFDQAQAAVPDLIEALHDGDALVRGRAALALSGFSSQANVIAPALVATLTDPEAEVRAKAADALSGLGPRGKAGVPALLRLVREGNPNEQFQAALTLVQFGEGAEPAVPVLARALAADNSRGVRDEAADALGRIGPAAAPAVPALLAASWNYLLNEDNKADMALRQIGLRAALPYLAQALHDKDGRVCQHAAEMLGDYGPAAKDAIPALREELAGDDHVRRVLAAEALWRVDPRSPAALAALKAALTDADAHVRDLAAEKLKKVDPAEAAAAGVK